MAFVRGVVAFLALAPVALLTDRPAAANEPGAAVLPQGMHLTRNGRYVVDNCDHSARVHCYSHKLMPVGYKPGDAIHPFAGPPLGAMTPADVLAGYSIPASTKANGKIVAIIDMPDTGAFADLTAYRSQYSLPPLPKCVGGLPDGVTPCFAAVDEDGNANPTVTDGGSGPDGETALDMDMISAACPDCSILLVQMTAAGAPQNIDDFTRGVAAATKLGALASSISFGGSESIGGGDPTAFTTPSNLVLAASGDQGYLLQSLPTGGGTSPSWPSSTPTVVSVGGTDLKSAGGSYTEDVWNDLGTPNNAATGSGCSTEYPMPPFQIAYGASKFGTTCASKRATSDLSAAAQFSTNGQEAGIAVYQGGTWHAVLGTSASAPLVAAAFVRLGVAKQIAADFGFIYSNASAFNDITSGKNDAQNLCTAGDVVCTAGPGWDGPTGIGSPIGTKLAALAGPSTTDGGTGTDGGGTNDGGGHDSGAVDSGSPIIPFTDAGDPLNPEGGIPVNDAGSSLQAIGSSTAGCGCTTPGKSAPLQDTGVIALVVGAVAALGSRSRKRARK